MGTDLIAADPALSVLEAALAWLLAIVTWMGGVVVALVALAVVLYAGLLWEQRSSRRPRRRPAPKAARRPRARLQAAGIAVWARRHPPRRPAPGPCSVGQRSRPRRHS